MTEITEEQFEKERMDEYLEEERKFYAEQTASIDTALAEIGGTAREDFEALIDGCNVTRNVKIVDKPEGRCNKDESFGVFTEIWVDQFSVGDSGDSFAGSIFAKFGENKWLEIPYSC